MFSIENMQVLFIFCAFQSRFERKRYIPNCFPPVLPNGWIPVLESSKLKVNMVKTLNIAGELTLQRYPSQVYVSEGVSS